MKLTASAETICACFIFCLPFLALTTCTVADPLYCDENKPCKKGYHCNVQTNTCEMELDAGLDGSHRDGKLHDAARDLYSVDSQMKDKSVPESDVDAKDKGLEISSPDIKPLFKCGDGKVNGSEQCDGNNLGGKSCATSGYYAGVLACKSNCTIDTSGCYRWDMVSVRAIHSCAKRSTGTLWCWGYNASGQLGVGTTKDHNKPVQVGKLQWVRIF